jgi:hypothetical protein
VPVHTPAVYCSSSFRCCSGGEEDVEAAVTTYFCCVEEEEEEVNVDTGTIPVRTYACPIKYRLK